MAEKPGQIWGEVDALKVSELLDLGGDDSNYGCYRCYFEA
ncbi:MAG: hypothetical protein ACI8X5_002143 [Planctomycetota bacterium]|jgi:hypothetical protein